MQASATTSEGAVSVAYELPPGCPSIDDFERDVQQRAPRARFTMNGAVRKFRVGARPDAAEWVGEVTAIPEVDASSVRRVRGATCAEVESALALIVALALDPGALREPGSADGAATGQSAPGLPPSTPPAAPPPVIVPEAPPPRVVLPPLVETARGSAETGHRYHFRASWGAGALAALGVAPAALFGFGISADVTPARDRLLTWLVRLSASELFPREVGNPLKARFTGQFFSLEGCPVRLSLGRVVSLLPCVGLEAGVLEVGGLAQPHLATTQNQNAPFIAVIEPLRVAVRLGGLFSLEVDGTLGEPLRHDSFGYSRPPVHVHTIPTVTGSFGLGLRINQDFF